MQQADRSSLSVKMDLPERTERRYLIKDPSHLLQRLTEHFNQKKFSNAEYVETVYFNNDEHIVPFETSLKIRQYLPIITTVPQLSQSNYFLDIKRGLGERKEKVRISCTVDEATRYLNHEAGLLDQNLRPYAAVTYLRHHYVPRIDPGMRVTLDHEMRYYFFPYQSGAAVLIGDESQFYRLEIKIGVPHHPLRRFVDDCLEQEELYPVISKKHTAYNLLSSYRQHLLTTTAIDELPGVELEAKLDAHGEEVFSDIWQFYNSRQSRFYIPDEQAYVRETSSINRYYREGQRHWRVTLRGDQLRVVRKSSLHFLDSLNGLTCLSKRLETKEPPAGLDTVIGEHPVLLGELHKARKIFIVAHPTSGRLYHISLDHCVANGDVHHQVEIEYEGRILAHGTAAAPDEPSIVTDVVEICSEILEHFPGLTQSKLTKEEWLLNRGQTRTKTT